MHLATTKRRLFGPLFSGPPNVFDQPKRQDLSAAELVGNVDVGGFSGEEWINECWRPPQNDLPSLNPTCSLKNVGWKMSFPFGMAYFQVRTVSFREGSPDFRGNSWTLDETKFIWMMLDPG